MSLDPTRIINNMKRSFSAYLAGEVAPSTVNYDEDPFDTSGLTSWYAVRYRGCSTEPTGMGDLIEEHVATKGRYHVLNAEVSGWARDDSQRLHLGEMADKIVSLAEEPSITFYDYSDIENPVQIGKIYLRPAGGSFSPVWGGGGDVSKSNGEVHAEGRMVGFVLEVKLVAIAEVGS